MGSQQPRRPRILCVGMLTLDVVHVLSRMPAANEKIPELGQSIAVGGPASNAAATAAALGARVELVSGFGRSAATAFVAEQLRTLKVRWHDPSRGIPSPSPVSSILLTGGTGQRAVVGGAPPPLPAAAAVPDGLVEAADAVLLDGHAMPLARQAARRAGAAGIPVLLDGGSYKPGTEQLLADVDVAVLSADFVAPRGADALAWVREQGCRIAARSAGADPLLLRDDEGLRAVEVPAVDGLVDTLGAGDVLHGAAVYALAVGGLSDAARVLRFATAVASLSCRYPGALGWAADPAGRTLARRLSTELLHRPVDDGTAQGPAGSAPVATSRAESLDHADQEPG